MRRLAVPSPKWAALAVAGLVATATITGVVIASDHMDTPTVEFHPQYDVNDVYAFPGSSPDRVVLVLATQSPLTPAGTPSATFGDKSKVLYQLKVDNDGDTREDLVFQFTFTGAAGSQQVTVTGPMKPNEVGTANTLIKGQDKKQLTGAVNQVLGSPTGMQVFAGPRDDPFFIDLEAFFRILPDRKPESGPLSQIEQGALTFRPAGSAVDFLAGFNDLAIVVELPLAELTSNGNHPKFGVWGTTSHAYASASHN
jgi:hypothetical protein